jgi:hypothetical protein
VSFFSSSENDISLVAIEQNSAEYVLVLAAGMLVANELVLADDCTPYKCYLDYLLPHFL